MTRRLRRSHLAVLAAFTAISVTILVAVILLTQTDWGRRRVLAFGLDQLASRVHGEVKVADIRGNLLSGVRLENIEITDTAGRSFLRADTLAFRYSLTSLLRKHLAISDMHVVNGIVVLDQPPGEEWNYTRIFPTGAPKPHRGPGFGSWIQIHNLQVRNSHLVVRAAWTPRAELSGAERERTITRALAPTNREWIAPINGGYQTISQFYRVNGRFPFLRLADPDSVNRVIEIAELSMIALPFRPPAVEVRDLAATLIVTEDSLLVNDMVVTLPGTHGQGQGAYALNGRSAHAELALVRVSLADARFVDPSLPNGGGRLRLAVNRYDGRMRIVASNVDLRVEGGTFRGLADVQIGRGTFRVGPSDLRFANVDTRLVKRYINDAPLEAAGTLGGHVRLVGTPAALRVDGNTSYTERGGPTSRITADGMVGERGGAFIARNLRLRFNPLHLSLVRKYEPSVPYRGTLVGTTTLTGNSRSGFTVVADLIDTDPKAGRSHILANGRIEPRDGLTARNLRLRFLPLQVALLKQLEPEIPYGGTLTGTTTLTGSARRGFAVNADVTHTDPQFGRSRIGAIGRVMVADELIADRLRLRFLPAQTALARPFIDDLPYGGTVSGTATVSGSARRGFSIVADVTHADPEFGRSRIAANGRIGLRGSFTANDLKLRFMPAQMALLRPFVAELPYGGTVTGTTTLTGSEATGFNVVSDLVHNSEETGRSQVTANGQVSLTGGLAARGLRLGFQPLQLAVLRPFVRDLPIDGTLTGRTTVTGGLASEQVAATLDLEHRGSTGVSHLVGHANADWCHPTGVFDVNLRAPVLSLATIGAFAPSTGLRGSASGSIIARGTLSSLTADANLAIAAHNGTIHTRGAFDLSSPLKRYDFTSTVTAFNAGAVTTHAPQTRLTGTVAARGAGTDPATANATLTANLIGSRADGSPVVDSTIVDARLANGLATFDRAHIRLGSARGDFTGSFGLIGGRSGTLRYAFQVDTLSQFLAHIPVDSGIVRPRPMLQARRIAQARADSTRIARATEVQRAAVGYPPPPILKPDTLPLRRDTLAGSLQAEGTITGNVKRFDTEGRAEARNFTAGANHVGHGRATYTLKGFGTPDATFNFDAAGQQVALGGFAFDSARARLDYTGVRNRGSGSAEVALFQDPLRDYRLESDFTVALDQKRATLQNLTARFDTTQWTAARPANIGWGQPGVTIAGLDLRSNTGGTLRADGRLPTEGSADLRLDIEKLQLGDITALLQDTSSLQGVFDLHARVQGTTRAPVISGTTELTNASMRGTTLPDVKGTISYANRDLTTHLELFRATTRLAVADAHLPINLALADISGPRLARNSPLQLDVTADSLPLESLPSFTDLVSDVRGRVRGNLAVRGTMENPTTNGIAQLDLGSLRVNPTGVLYHDIVGTVRLNGSTAHVDSIVAHSSGTVRTTGTLDFTTLTRPGFDLAVVAADAWLLDNERGRIRADANLAVKGPYTEVHVTGDARVRRGVVYAPEMSSRRVTNLEDPTLRATVDTAGLGLDILPEPNLLLRNMHVEVMLQIDRDTWARNTQTNVEIFTPENEKLQIHLDNQHQVLAIEGLLLADRGEYTYAGRNFQLSTGSARFTGGPKIDPLLDLTARYQVQRRGLEALMIDIKVNGSLSEPRVTLQSNAQPPLSQSDLLGYLAFGQSTTSVLNQQSSGAFGVGNGGLVGLPALAEQQLANVAIGATIEDAVNAMTSKSTRHGLDVFRVHAGELPAEAAFESYFQNVVRGTEIEAGKYVTPRLYLGARGRASTYPGVALQYHTPIGLTWNAFWEPRYLPVEPSFSTTQTASQARALGFLLLWSRRY